MCKQFKANFDGSIDYARSTIVNFPPVDYKNLVKIAIATITAEEGDCHDLKNDPDVDRIVEFNYTECGGRLVYVVASSNPEMPRFWTASIDPELHRAFFTAHPVPATLVPSPELIAKYLEIASQVALDLMPLAIFSLSQL